MKGNGGGPLCRRREVYADLAATTSGALRHICCAGCLRCLRTSYALSLSDRAAIYPHIREATAPVFRTHAIKGGSHWNAHRSPNQQA